MNDIPVVILAGGLGTRLGQDPEKYPKVLAPVLNEPFLNWKMQNLLSQGIKTFYLLLGKGAESVVRYLNKSKFQNIDVYCFEDGNNLLGTGGSLVKSKDLLPNRFLLTFGDNLLIEPISKFNDSSRFSSENVIVATSYTGKSDKKNLFIKNNKILNYSKSPGFKGTHTDYGYMILNSDVLDQYKSEVFLDLSQIIVDLIRSENLSVHLTSEQYFEIGTPETLKETEIWLQQNKFLFN